MILASGLRVSLYMSVAHCEIEPILERMAEQASEMSNPWLEGSSPILCFLANFVEAALWPDGIAVAGFLPPILIDRLTATAFPLQPSVVLPAEGPKAYHLAASPRSARYGGDSAGRHMRGAARAKPSFATLLGRRRV